MKSINIEDTGKLDFKVGNYEKVILECAEDSVKILEKISPRRRKKGRKIYRKGWRYSQDRLKDGFESTVYNKTTYQLTHLLENGHFIVNPLGDKFVGWAKPHKHISTAYNQEKPIFIEKMRKIGIEIKK